MELYLHSPIHSLGMHTDSSNFAYLSALDVYIMLM